MPDRIWAGVCELDAVEGEPMRAGRTYIAVTIYLLVFALLVVVLSHFYLIPALKASHHATPREREKLAAGALLVLLVVLFGLGAGLLLTFRIGRWFFPSATKRAKPTRYV